MSDTCGDSCEVGPDFVYVRARRFFIQMRSEEEALREKQGDD